MKTGVVKYCVTMIPLLTFDITYSQSNYRYVPIVDGECNDRYLAGQLPAATPEIIKIKDQYYIVALM